MLEGNITITFYEFYAFSSAKLLSTLELLETNISLNRDYIIRISRYTYPRTHETYIVCLIIVNDNFKQWRKSR